MSTWVGISSLVGADSLDGFAVGVMASGALFLAMTAPRRVRRWRAAAASTRGVPASTSVAEAGSFGADAGAPAAGSPGAAGLDPGSLDAGSLGAGSFGTAVFEGEAFGSGPAVFGAEPAVFGSEPAVFGADVEVLVSEPDVFEAETEAFEAQAGQAVQPVPEAQVVSSGSSGPGRATYRSRHRLGAAIASASLPGETARDGAEPDAPFPDVAFCDVPDVAFADAAPSDGMASSSKRPEVRRLPRHAAPTVSFGTKMSGRVMGLFAARRPVTGGASS
jgi:hypothetical protein